MRACHALALDDERTTFHPLLWDESEEKTITTDQLRDTKDQRLCQVWFAGVHANVGGGYPDDSLSNVSLNWILAEAKDCGLSFKVAPKADPDALVHAKAAQDKDGRLYDSRSGLGGYYRYGPRRVYGLCHAYFSRKADDKVEIQIPKIHESVFGRIKTGAHLYAPIGLPPDYAVVRADRSVVLHSAGLAESKDQAEARSAAQEEVWDVVWKRRATYFLTVFASLYLVFYPLFMVTHPFMERQSRLRFVSDLVRMIEAFLPSGASRWGNAYASDPAAFLVAASMVALLISYGSRLGAKISDRMRQLWNEYLGLPNPGGAVATGWSIGLGNVKWFVIVTLLIYIALYRWLNTTVLGLPGYYDFQLLRLTEQPIRFMIFVFLFVYLVPLCLIRAVRTLPAYQNVLWSIKYWLAPGIFAFLILYCAVAFGSHYLFNIRDDFGAFCPDRKLDPNIYGLARCRNENLARCDGRGTMACPAACEEPVRTFDLSSTNRGADRLCSGTGIALEVGGDYLIKVERSPRDAAWTFWREPSHTWGTPVSELSWWEGAVMTALYPFRRTFDRPWGSIILRYGSTGAEEDFLDPDPKPDPKDQEMLTETLKPKRDGELFVYLNEPVIGIWGAETWLADLIGNEAKMKMTIKKTK
jgi:hypothetical protein